MKKASDLVLKGMSNSDISDMTNILDLQIIDSIRTKVINGLRKNISCKIRKNCKIDIRDIYNTCGTNCKKYIARDNSNFIFQVGKK